MRRNLHIVGCPRSGTTLLAEMMSTCFAVDGSSEHEESIFKLAPHADGLYVSKKPNDILWLHRLLDRDDSLHAIAMIRDPRAVVCSIHSGHPGMYFCNYPVWKRAEKALRRIRNHPRVLVVAYEDLVASPDAVQQNIQGAFPFLRVVHPFSEFHLHARSSQKSINALGGVRAVDQGRSKGWLNHLPRLKQQLDRHPGMGEDIVRYGYESDDGWTRILDCVEPQVFPCRYSDRGEWLKYLEQSLRYNGKIRRYLGQRGL
ncbi:MAG: hypothetical protein IPN00_04860 [Hydrogenophilales bacterium]|nr:hypothetical protein [Hydrogenophilales bacterium]